MTVIPASEECSSPVLDRRFVEYAYQDGDGLVFVDVESDALVTLPHDRAGAWRLYLKEGHRVQLNFHDGRPLSVESPAVVELAVADTAPSVPTATASKPALLETGLKIMVPGFIDVGERIVVDTRKGTYLRKADGARP
jgi:elongation factor P